MTAGRHLKVFDLSGKDVGQVAVEADLFPSTGLDHVVWQVVRAQLAGRRAGTHSSLRRSEVRGGGKKPYKQKGTGRARQGSTRSPQFVGGGGVFTPKPRDYAQRVTKKMRALALARVLSSCIDENRLVVLDGALDKPIAAVQMLALLEKAGLSSAVVVADEHVRLGNVRQVKVVSPQSINVYDIVRYKGLVLSVEALRQLQADIKKTVSAS